MIKFTSNKTLRSLVENSYKAIDEGCYNLGSDDFKNHSQIDLTGRILSCQHSPLITEIKFSSPSRGEIKQASKGTHLQIASEMVMGGATAISVLTQPYLFKGSLSYLLDIRKNVNIPILMKDIIVSDVQIDAARRTGADCVLLIKRIFDLGLTEGGFEKLAEYASKKGLQTIFEVHTKEEFDDVLKIRQTKAIIGINNRNLEDMSINLNTTIDILKENAKSGNRLIISESGISTPEDIRLLRSHGAHGFLVGSGIMEAADIRKKVNELYMAL